MSAVSLPYWLHCNRCGSMACEKNSDMSKFSITSCGHVFCNECLARGVQLCFICEHSPLCTQVIDETMSVQTRKLFMPPMVLMKNALKKVRGIMAYQQMQFEIWMELLQQKNGGTNTISLNQSKCVGRANKQQRLVHKRNQSSSNHMSVKHGDAQVQPQVNANNEVSEPRECKLHTAIIPPICIASAPFSGKEYMGSDQIAFSDRTGATNNVGCRRANPMPTSRKTIRFNIASEVKGSGCRN